MSEMEQARRGEPFGIGGCLFAPATMAVVEYSSSDGEMERERERKKEKKRRKRMRKEREKAAGGDRQWPAAAGRGWKIKQKAKNSSILFQIFTYFGMIFCKIVNEFQVQK